MGPRHFRGAEADLELFDLLVYNFLSPTTGLQMCTINSSFKFALKMWLVMSIMVVSPFLSSLFPTLSVLSCSIFEEVSISSDWP